MSSQPVVLVVATDETSAECIIRAIKAEKGIPLYSGSKVSNIWKIKNKYYTAEVSLQAITDANESVDARIDLIEAIILYINNAKGETLKDVVERQKILTEMDCEMKILLCDKCDENFSKNLAMSWCLNNNFELIELLEVPEMSDDFNPIKDYYGIERLIQTLHAHPWSNHQLIEDSGHSHNSAMIDCDEENEDMEHMDQFCKVFSQMSSVSQNAASLPSEGRKAYAEQVVKVFWQAIGGDEAELDDSVN